MIAVEDAKDAVGYPDSPLWFSLEAPECSYCGDPIRRGAAKRGKHHICPECAEKHHEDEWWRVEDAMRNRSKMR